MKEIECPFASLIHQFALMYHTWWSMSIANRSSDLSIEPLCFAFPFCSNSGCLHGQASVKPKQLLQRRNRTGFSPVSRAFAMALFSKIEKYCYLAKKISFAINKTAINYKPLINNYLNLNADTGFIFAAIKAGRTEASNTSTNVIEATRT